MRHVDLRAVEDDDLDAIFEMMRDRDAAKMVAFGAEDPDDRDAFDEWMSRRRASDEVDLLVVTEDGGFAGTAASFAVGADREVSFWVARHAWGRGVATEALRLLVAREPERPLFGRVAAHNAGAIAVFERNGFTELSRAPMHAPALGREVDEIVYVLTPALDGV